MKNNVFLFFEVEGKNNHKEVAKDIYSVIFCVALYKDQTTTLTN